MILYVMKYNELYNNFKVNSFQLKKTDKITHIIKQKKVPNTFGIYIFYKNINTYENIIYIGKAEEIITDGSHKKQGLSKRL